MDNNKGYSCVRIPSVPVDTIVSSDKKVLTSCKPPVTPNPVFPSTASLTTCTPLEVSQSRNNVFVTVSIPAEAIITLPKYALEIKRITKNLKITQCRFFHAPAPIVAGAPQDCPKLFLAGFVRKDIEFSTPKHATESTVAGDIRDFVVDVPISCVVDLGNVRVPALEFDKQKVFEHLKTQALPAGFSAKDQLMMGDLSEHNSISNKFLNALPTCRLIFSQINEMDDAIDRVPLPGGPFEEGIFRTIQEKMIVTVQVMLTF
jgi:hypothetical protein